MIIEPTLRRVLHHRKDNDCEELYLRRQASLGPILMTALTTILGLIPIIIQRPALGGTYYYSMALVIIGGITISTFLTSVLLPTTVTIIEDLPRWVKRVIVGIFRPARNT